MDAMMKIQVRVQAREAQQALRQLTAGIRSLERAGSGGGSAGRSTLKTTQTALGRINRDLDQLRGKSVFTDLDREAARFNTRLHQVNRGIANLGNRTFETRGPTSRWSPDVAARKAAQQEAADRAATARAARDSLRLKKIVDAEAAAHNRDVARAARESLRLKKVIDAETAAADREVSKKAREALRLKKVVDAEAAAASRKVAADARNALRMKKVVDAEAAAADKLVAKQARDALRLKKVVDAEAAAAEKARLAQQKAAQREAEVLARRQAEYMTVADKFHRAIVGPSAGQSRGLIAFGKDLQWVGRQLNFNFTIPLVAATTAVTNWYLENERAWTRVKKVYGDGSRDYTEELGKVQQAIRLLSDLYGIQQDQVTELAASWAAAGATGADLARSVESTVRLAILGDYEDYNRAFQDLITIQGAYKLSAEQTATAVGMLNTAENMSAASMQDFTRALALAGGVAQSAGVGIDQLAAMVAALVPSTGSAANAGNALKTIISNMVQPTAALVEVLRAVGIEFYGAEFQALGIADRLEFVANRMNTLTDSQRTYIGAVAAGDRQINRFITLVEAMRDETSIYNEVLKDLDVSNAAKNFEMANKEIQTLLASDPRQLEILVTQIKNMLIEAITPLIPSLIYLVSLLRDAIQWFTSLDPAIQKAAVAALAGVVAVGLLSQFVGSLILLFGQLLRPISWAASAFSGLGGSIMKMTGIMKIVPAIAGRAGAMSAIAFTGPWGIAIAAALAALYIFRDKVAAVGEWIAGLFTKLFNALPAGIQNALMKVVGAIRGVIEWIANLFGQVSPFDREEIRRTTSADQMDRIASANQAATASGAVDAILGGASAATSSATASDTVTPLSDAQAAVAAYDRQIELLNGRLAAMKPSLDAQEAATRAAEDAYNAANRAADLYDRSLEPLRDTVDSLGDAINAANAKIRELANTPIAGMKSFENAIFDNEMAQKRLRLEILRMGDAAEEYEKVQDKIADINGDIESLRSRMTTLRESGAGSDILAVYERELAALETQRDGLMMSENNASQLADQLKELERQAEILELEKALAFDPLVRQIDELANGVSELTFDQIVNGIREQQSLIEQLTPAYESANTELAAQEIILQGLREQSDLLQDAYNRERDALEVLSSAYADVESSIRDMEQAKNEASAGNLPGGGDFADLTGEFEDVQLPEFLETGNLDAMIAEWTKQSEAMWDQVDIWAPVKEQWEGFKGWWGRNVGGGFSGLWDVITMDPGKLRAKIAAGFRSIMSAVPHGDRIYAGIVDGLDALGRGISRLKPVIEPVIEALGRIAYALYEIYEPTLKPFVDYLFRIAGPVIEHWFTMIGGALTILAGILGTVANLINGDFRAAWDSFKTIFEGVGIVIESFVKTIGTLLWETLVLVVDTFWALGSRIINTFVAGMEWAFGDALGWFVGLGGRVTTAIGNTASWLWSKGVDLLVGFFRGVWAQWDAAKNTFSGLGGKVASTIGSVGNLLWGKGVDLLVGFFRGVWAQWDAAKHFFSNLGSTIAGSMGNIGSSLWQAGAKLLSGFWDGLKWAWDNIRNWWNNSIGSWGFSIGGFSISVPDLPSLPDNAFVFHRGGIVPGSGDVNAVLQGREMVLTTAQQARLFSIANGQAATQGGDHYETKNYYFGDLSFPNITDSGDAGRFIDNLELIAS